MKAYISGVVVFWPTRAKVELTTFRSRPQRHSFDIRILRYELWISEHFCAFVSYFEVYVESTQTRTHGGLNKQVVNIVFYPFCKLIFRGFANVTNPTVLMRKNCRNIRRKNNFRYLWKKTRYYLTFYSENVKKWLFWSKIPDKAKVISLVVFVCGWIQAFWTDESSIMLHSFRIDPIVWTYAR